MVVQHLGLGASEHGRCAAACTDLLTQDSLGHQGPHYMRLVWMLPPLGQLLLPTRPVLLLLRLALALEDVHQLPHASIRDHAATVVVFGASFAAVGAGRWGR